MKYEYAYITSLTSENYIPGVFGLKRSLIKTKSNYKLYVLIPRNISKTILQLSKKLFDQYCSYIILDGINGSNQTQYYWDLTFFKLQAASLIQFKKIILLDSDMLVNKNIDHLFSCDPFSAVVAGKSSHSEYVDLNSGLLVLEPSINLFNDLIDLCPGVIKERNAKKLFAGDQDVFISYITDWKANEKLHLSERYNCFYNDLYRVSKNIGCKPTDMFVIHFIGKEKPWMKKNKKYLMWLIKERRFSQFYFYFQYLRLCRVKK